MIHVRRYVLAAVCILALSPFPVWAQDALSLSVTPTLFDISVDPGQVWQSSIRVINPNQYDISVYAQPVNFSARGEGGTGTFEPIFESETQGVTLAEWIDVSDEAIRVPMQQTVEIPFRVQVPDTASPGGQFAAILISTQPPAGSGQGSQVRTTQAVSSLFFMRIEGDVDERGLIRSFRTTDRVVQSPENTFELRFQNQGNVHIQPQGTITIYNMWGERRGEIPINHRSQFGKVLPESIRTFTFGWEGEFSLVDIGRYRAEVTLAYGQSDRSFVSGVTHFWVIPIYGLLITLGSIVVIIIIAALLVRAYVRRMLALSGVGQTTHRRTTMSSQTGDIDLGQKPKRTKDRQSDMVTVLAPIRAGFSDLGERLRSEITLRERCRIFMQALLEYRMFVLGVVFVVIVVIVSWWFLRLVTVDDRAFEVTVDEPTEQTAISSEEIRYQELRQEEVGYEMGFTIRADMLSGATSTPVEIINVSGVSGAAAELRIHLEAAGIDVATVSTDLNRIENRSVVVYDPASETVALQFSQALSGALLSARAPDTVSDIPITIYLGQDVAVQ